MFVKHVQTCAVQKAFNRRCEAPFRSSIVASAHLGKVQRQAQKTLRHVCLLRARVAAPGCELALAKPFTQAY